MPAVRCDCIVDPVASDLESRAGVTHPVVSHEQPIGVVGREREDRHPGLRERRGERGQDPGQVERQRPTDRQRPPTELRLHIGGNNRLRTHDRQLVNRAGSRHQRSEYLVGPSGDDILRRQAADREQRRVQIEFHGTSLGQ